LGDAGPAPTGLSLVRAGGGWPCLGNALHWNAVLSDAQAGDSPTRPESALGPYLRAISAHRLLVVVITLVTVVASAAWLVLRSPSYEATAQLLVTPLPPDDSTFIGVQVLRESNEPTRTMQTAATLVSSRQAAQLAAERLGSGWTVRRVLESVEVKPQGESNVLAVTAQADDPRLAARIADVFSRAALEARQTALRRQVDAAIGQLRAQGRRPGENSEIALDRAQRLNQLQVVRRGVDPTLSLSQPAGVPSAPLGPPAWLVMLLSSIAGLTLATGAALLLETVDRRLRDEDEIVRLYPLPVLARVPSLPRRLLGGRAQALISMPPAVREAFRTVQAQLDQPSKGPRTILMTSASAGDGKTTSSVHLAFCLVVTGHRVLLMDFDFRHPELGQTLGVRTRQGVLPLLTSEASLSELLLDAPGLPPNLRVIPASANDDVAFLEAYAHRLPEILAQAKGLADYVILDTAPLGEVSDALRFVSEVDDIIVVTRPGHTDRASFELARDLLGRAGRVPAGLLVIGQTVSRSPYHADGWGLEKRQEAGRLRSASF
jgi:tyrosine-protein kinase